MFLSPFPCMTSPCSYRRNKRPCAQCVPSVLYDPSSISLHLVEHCTPPWQYSSPIEVSVAVITHKWPVKHWSHQYTFLVLRLLRSPLSHQNYRQLKVSGKAFFFRDISTEMFPIFLGIVEHSVLHSCVWDWLLDVVWFTEWVPVQQELRVRPYLNKQSNKQKQNTKIPRF